jgi:hypothetical protein
MNSNTGRKIRRSCAEDAENSKDELDLSAVSAQLLRLLRPVLGFYVC